MPSIFISYRRDDSAGWAGHLHAALQNSFGKDQVFIDIHQEAGLDYISAIEKKLESCDILLVVIGPRWLTITDKKGQRRLDDPKDLVRQEVAVALRRGKTQIVPVLVGDASMPSPDDLPEELKKLAAIQAHELIDKLWDYNQEQLIKLLRIKLLRTSPNKPKIFYFFARLITNLITTPRWIWINLIAVFVLSGSFVLISLDFSKSKCESRTRPDNLHVGLTFRDCECCPQMVVLPNGVIMSQYETTLNNYEIYQNRSFSSMFFNWFANSDRCYVYRALGNSGEFIFDSTKDWKNPGHLQEGDSPVVCVNWNDAHEYAKWLSKLTNQNYRLPTIEEFSYATKADTDSKFPWGDEVINICKHANINDKSSHDINRFPWLNTECSDGYPLKSENGVIQTAPTGAPFQPNGFKIYHLIGNVYEWLNLDPKCIIAGQTGIGGGSWTSAPDGALEVSSWCQSKEFKAFDIGFRLVRGS
jgi:formylglycine-generating enzyme required for sulfatase activity